MSDPGARQEGQTERERLREHSRPDSGEEQRREARERIEAAKLNRCISRAIEGMMPPDDLTVTQWAEKYRRLSSESSAEPGPWRTQRTPYLREVMDAFTDPKVRHIVMVAASQVGKTEAELNMIGYIIDQDPGSILFVHPVTIDAKEFAKLRISPMIRDSPTLARKVAAPKSRDSGNTILQKTYPGGILTLCGSTEAHALASKPIRYVFGDERDRWATSAGNEGDPWALAMARQTTFYNAKAVEVSTPTIKSASKIARAYAGGTMERWKSRCPHCGEYHEIRWKDIRYDYTESVVAGGKFFSVRNIHYCCPGCACVSDEYTMKKAPAKWVAENPAAYDQGTRSFWLNAFVSQWAGWESIILRFLRAMGSSVDMQVVYNTCFGELWEDRGDIADEEGMLARREDYGQREDGSAVELPEGVLVLTCGVDVQLDRLEYEVVGHGHFSETWGIRYGVIVGRPDAAETWEKLDEVISHTFRFRDGLGLNISLTFVDEGGLFTQEVRQRCRERISRRVFCSKGFFGENRPYTSPPKKVKIVVNKRQIGECYQYQLGVDAGKQQIMDNLRVKEPGSHYCHFPRRDDYGPAYFRGLLSEHRVHRESRQNPWQWEIIPGHERNEPLDCRNYAMAAFKVLPADLDKIHRLLEARRGKTQRQGPPAAQGKQAPRPKPKRRGGVSGLFEEW